MKLKHAQDGVSQRFQGLHVLIDDDPRWSIHPISQAEAACRGGAHVLQLRCKHSSDQQTLEWALQMRALTRRHGICLIVNDRFDLALASEADGVHLGQKDLPPSTVSKISGQRLAIGRSTHTTAELLASGKEPVDYVAFGPVFGTASKASEYTARGLEALAQARALIEGPPLIAIGGLSVSNLEAVIQAGADGAAVISAVLGATDPVASTQQLAACFNHPSVDGESRP